MDRLEAMAVLLAAVEAGTFSAAGRRLGMPLTTVSRKVAELEAHLNARLLVRSTRKLALTDVGLGHVAACKRILEEVGSAESEAAGEYSTPKGELVLTAPMAFGRTCVLPIVSEFLKNYPEINVRLLLSDRNLNLLDEHVDVAVRVGELPDSRMVAIRLGSIRRVVCGSPSYFAIHGMPRTPADLAGFTCVTFTGLAAGAPWAFKSRNGLSQPVPPRCRLNINTAEAAVDAAVAGVGLTHVLSYHVAQAVAEGKLQIVLRAFEPGPLSVSLVHAGQDLLPLKMRRFLEFSGPRLRKALAIELPEG